MSEYYFLACRFCRSRTHFMFGDTSMDFYKGAKKGLRKFMTKHSSHHDHICVLSGTDEEVTNFYSELELAGEL